MIPIIVGRFIPSQKAEDSRTLYCAAIICLLKLWWTILELQLPEQSWEMALNSWKLSDLSEKDRDIISNIEYYHETRTAAEEDVDINPVATDKQGAPVTHNDWEDHEDVDVEMSNFSLPEPRPTTATQSKLKQYADGLVNSPECEYAFRTVGNMYSTGYFTLSTLWNIEGEATRATKDTQDRLNKWQSEIDASLQGVETADVHVDFSNVFQANYLLFALTDFEGEVLMMNKPANTIGVNTLNTKLRLTYNIIDRHIAHTLSGDNPKQLLMLVHGPGGTGKSKITDFITQTVATCGDGKWLKKGAFTGIAASLIGGRTIHLLTKMSIKKSNSDVDVVAAHRSAKLQQLWADIKYLIINEISMIGCEFLHKLSLLLCHARLQSQLPFGGISILVFGDFHQFPPIGDSPLYWTNDTASDSVDKIIGHSLYEQFEMAVVLGKQMRLVDSRWTVFLDRLWNGECNKATVHWSNLSPSNQRHAQIQTLPTEYGQMQSTLCHVTVSIEHRIPKRYASTVKNQVRGYTKFVNMRKKVYSYNYSTGSSLRYRRQMRINLGGSVRNHRTIREMKIVPRETEAENQTKSR